jgi:hypothetical protein
VEEASEEGQGSCRAVEPVMMDDDDHHHHTENIKKLLQIYICRAW